MSATRKPAVLPVAVVILNWNGKALTEACVASWLRARPRPKRLLVVDNGSTDGSVAFLRRRFKGLEILALPSNLGFAAGNNRGFEHLRRTAPGVEAVFACNNDTELSGDMLGLLWQGLKERPHWGVAGPRILFHGTDRIWFEGAVIRPLTGRSGHLAYGAPAHPAPGPLASPGGPAPFELPANGFVSGCGLLVRSPVLEALGGFDERLWAYGEDSDLCLRARELGFSCGIVPGACMSHKVSSSFVLGSPLSLYYNTRNSCALLRRHRLGYGALTRCVFGLVQVGLAGRWLWRRRPAAASAVLGGLFDGLRGSFRKFGEAR